MLDFVFTEVFTCGYEFVSTAEQAHVVYGVEAPSHAIHIQPHPLLLEEGIRELHPSVSYWHDVPVLFGNDNSEIPFDLLAAIFFLISRYEEYQPYTPDEFNRYPHQSSFVFQHGLLSMPLVDIWLAEFEMLFQKKYAIKLPRKPVQWIPTYDIDIAYSYLGKSMWRTIGGFTRDLLHGKLAACTQRLRVLGHKQKDPYDAFDTLDELHQQCAVHPIYFFLLSDGGPLDKNLAPEESVMQSLLQRIRTEYTVGIHPSVSSHKTTSILSKEIARIPGVTLSRQHYIQFTLPETFRHLIAQGIQADYSMGYGSINGFRASTAHTFYWYDIAKEEITTLRLHPFCFMECNTRFEQHQTAETAWQEMQTYWNQVQRTGGQFISIWHNFSLGTDPDWAGWKEAYRKFASSFHQQ